MSPKKPIETPDPNDTDPMDPELAQLLQGADDIAPESGGSSFKKDSALGLTPQIQDTITPGGPPVSQGDFANLITALVDNLKGLALSPDTLKEILRDVGKSNAEIAHKARWPENTTHPHISAFSYPEGDIAHPKPVLSRETFFCGVREKEEALTPAEILGYNDIKTPREVRGGAWRAEIRKPLAVGAKEVLHVWVPKETVDQRMMLPSLSLILHELNGGKSTEDVMSLLAQIETLKQLLANKGATAAELEAALTAS